MNGKQCVRCGGYGHDSDECKLPVVGSNDNQPPLRVYIAGPMTGLPESNYPAFHAAAANLRQRGYLVENPAENSLPACSSWRDYMRAGITQLMRCDAIVLLPGHANSRGAMVEWNLARDIGIPYIRLDHLLEGKPFRLQAVA